MYVVGAGIARRRAIEIGHRGRLEVEVIDGLSPGVHVIVHPSDKLADGIAVTPRG